MSFKGFQVYPVVMMESCQGSRKHSSSKMSEECVVNSHKTRCCQHKKREFCERISIFQLDRRFDIHFTAAVMSHRRVM